MKTKKENNKNGFSVVEVMVASGLMAIVSVGMLTMLGNANKSQRSMQAKGQQREIISEMISHLTIKAACQKTTFGLDPRAGALNIPVIKNADDSAKYRAATDHPAGLIQYKNFTLKDWTPDSAATPYRGTANLAVTMARLGDTSGPKDLKPENIGLRVYLDPSTNQITDCFSMGSAANGFWNPDPANPNKITYGGDVEVTGGIKVGAVGLDIDTACTVKGQQRFNTTSQVMQFCNGTSWAPLGVPSGGLKLYRNPYDADRLIALTDAAAAVVAAPYYPQCTQCGSACSPAYCAAGYSNAGESCIFDGRCNARTSRVRRCTRTCIGTGYGAPIGSIVPVN